jgi:SAM-dependent methyltransferase
MPAPEMQTESKLSLEERFLLKFAVDPSEPEIGATANYTIENCLDFAHKTIADFDSLIKGKSVLDYGCGPGFQAVAMRSQLGADHVFGLDIDPVWLDAARKRASEHNCQDAVEFGDTIPADRNGKFDVVVSLCAFEHYGDPGRQLATMRDQLRPGGVALIAFAEPWYSHSGSHIGNYTRLPIVNRPWPWLNLFFSDRAMLTLRSRYRADRPEKIEDIVGGLNRMTIGRFESIVANSGMEVVRFDTYATLGLPLVTKIPVFRELLTGSLSAILRRRPS